MFVTAFCGVGIDKFRYVGRCVYSPIMRLTNQSPKFSEFFLASLPLLLPLDDLRREVDDRRSSTMLDAKALLRDGSNYLTAYDTPVRRQALSLNLRPERFYQDAGVADVRAPCSLRVLDPFKKAHNMSLAFCYQTSDLISRVQEDLERGTLISERVAISRMVQAELPRDPTSSPSLLSEVYSDLGWPWTDRSSFAFASRVLFAVLGSAPSRRRSPLRYAVPMDIAMSARNAPESWQPVFDSLQTLTPDRQAKVRRMVEIVTLDPWVTSELPRILDAVDRVIRALQCLNWNDVRQMSEDLWLRLRVLLLCELNTSLRCAARDQIQFPKQDPTEDFWHRHLEDVADLNSNDQLVRMLPRGAQRALFVRNLENHLMTPDAWIPNFPCTTRDETSVWVADEMKSTCLRLEQDMNRLSLILIESPSPARLLLLLTPLALVSPGQMYLLGTETIRCLVNRAHFLARSYYPHPSFSFSEGALLLIDVHDSDEEEFGNEDESVEFAESEESVESVESVEYEERAWIRPYMCTEFETDGIQQAEEGNRRCAVCLIDYDASDMKYLRRYKAQWRDRESLDAAEIDFSLLQAGQLASNYCGHVFHKCCRDSWVRPVCAMCRAPWMKAGTAEPHLESAENVPIPL